MPSEPVAEVRVLQIGQATRLEPDETAVVVDVLRATSTVAVALHRGARTVVPVQSPEHARRVADGLEDVVLVGERARGALDGFVDNSPARLAELELDQRNVVLTTTNGTGALLACHRAGRVVAGGMVNASALAGALGGQRVALVAAGWRGTPASDDDACCAYLAELLQGGEPDLAATLSALELSTSAIMLRKHEKGDDVDVCLSLDEAPVVPVLDGAALRRWAGTS